MTHSTGLIPVARRVGGIVLLGLALLAQGCISSNRTTYREQTRVSVEFENDTAGRLFYEALSRMRERHGRSESTTQISVPIVFERKTTVVEGESVVFNEAVLECDTNHDGRITEVEARIFSERLK